MSPVVALLVIILVAGPAGGALVIWLIGRLADSGAPMVVAVGVSYLVACAFAVVVTLLLGGAFA